MVHEWFVSLFRRFKLECRTADDECVIDNDGLLARCQSFTGILPKMGFARHVKMRVVVVVAPSSSVLDLQ